MMMMMMMMMKHMTSFHSFIHSFIALSLAFIMRFKATRNGLLVLLGLLIMIISSPSSTSVDVKLCNAIITYGYLSVAVTTA